MTTYLYNGNLIAAPVTFLSNKPVFAVDSISLKQYRTAQDAQRWEVSFGALTNDNVAETFLASITEMDATSSMIMPQLKEVDDRRTASGSMVAAAEAVAGADTVTFALSNTGLLPKGSFVKFANHTKVYITTADFIFGSNTVLNIFPKLVATVPSSTAFNYGSGCVLTYFRSINNSAGITYVDGVLADVGTITVVEAI